MPEERVNRQHRSPQPRVHQGKARRLILGGYRPGGAAVPAAPTKQSYLPTDFTEFTDFSGGEYSPTDFTDTHRFLGCVLPPNLCTSVQSVGVFVGGYGIPAIPTPPSEFLPQNPLQVCLHKSSHGIHGIHRIFRRRRAFHGFHRCTQIFLLRQSFLCVP